MNQPKVTQKTEQQIGIIGISIIIIIVLAIYPIKDFVTQLKDQNAKFAGNKETIDNYEEKIRKLNEFQELINKNKDNLDKLSISLPVASEVPELLTQVKNIAAKHNLALMSFTPKEADIKSKTGGQATSGESGETTTTQKTTTNANVDTLRITMALGGTYTQLIDYLTDIENNVRPIKIIGITLATGKTGEDVPGIAIAINAETYYQKSATETTSQTTSGSTTE